MSKLAKFVKATLGGGAIVGFGYLLMKTTTPSDQELIDSLSPELRAKYEQQKRARQEQNRQIYDTIQREGYGDEPVWRKEPKDVFQSEAALQRDLNYRMRQHSQDNEIDKERQRMRELAQQEKR